MLFHIAFYFLVIDFGAESIVTEMVEKFNQMSEQINRYHKMALKMFSMTLRQPAKSITKLLLITHEKL